MCEFLCSHLNDRKVNVLVYAVAPVQSVGASAAGLLSRHLCNCFRRMSADASVPSSTEGRPLLKCALVDVGLMSCTTRVKLLDMSHNAGSQVSFRVKRTGICTSTLLLPCPHFTSLWCSAVFITESSNNCPETIPIQVKRLFILSTSSMCIGFRSCLLSWPVLSIICSNIEPHGLEIFNKGWALM